MQTHWHAISSQEALRTLKTSGQGLSAAEVATRRTSAGWNELPREHTKPWWVFLARQTTSPLILVLGVAAVMSVVLRDWIDAGVIAIAIVLNTIVGFVQEYRANRTLERLREYVQPRAVVRREGGEVVINARELVPGDILLLQAGDKVSVDARLIETSDVETNESALTGESTPVRKHLEAVSVGTALAERQNMVHAGTVMIAGRAVAVVTATGVHTELGKIAELVKSTPEQRTPLQTELHRLAIWISGVVLVLVVVLFAAGVVAGRPWIEMFETSVALAVAAIPEGLTVSVTIILAIGMQRILKRKALTRRLIAAETLGSVSVICTDKTGTITEGEMQVSDIVLESGPVRIADVTSGEAAKELLRVLEIGLLCNDAVVGTEQEMENPEVSGSPTERALMQAGLQVGLHVHALRERHPRFEEIPFDSTRKYMATFHEKGRGTLVLLKGAPERVLDRCRMPTGQRAAVKKVMEEMSARGLRLIAMAEKTIAGHRVKPDERESVLADCTFVGFVGLRDPLRKEAQEQIRAAARAGIRTVMITGDHPRTALAIAQEVGMVVDHEGVITGEQLDAMDDDAFAARVVKIHVYARVEPRHKIRIVRAWQTRGEVVAMTGDGVNDAPALKAADIGVALGSGTEVAKEVGDVVLLDNNLSTITAAIEQGRVIFDNIRKSVAYLMTSSFTEIVLIGGSLLAGFPLPLLPLHILWINLVADTFPNIALTLEPGEPDVMQTRPRPRGEPVMSKQMLTLILLIGVITDLVLFLLYAWLLSRHTDIQFLQSFMFAAVGLSSIIFVFAIRSFRRSIFRTNPFSNPWLVAGVGLGAFMLVSVFVFPPLRSIFGTTPLLLSDWGLLLMMALTKLCAIEMVKEWILFKKTV